MSAANTIVVFARAPEPGKVKTRLAQQLGAQGANRLYVAMLRDTLDHAQSAANLIGDCKVAVAFTPEEAFGAHPYSLAELWSAARLFQGNGDLGEKIHFVFASLFAEGARRVVVIGSDMPTLQPPILTQAFDCLVNDSLIFGPAHDGGFYLIGTSAPFSKSLFADVQWSSDSTLQQVLRNAATLNHNTHLLPARYDIDTMEDLRNLALRLRTEEQRIRAAPHTLEALRRENLL